MQSCTWVLGYTVSMACGKPDRPSQQAFFSSVVEPGPFVLLDEPQEFLVAAQVNAQGQVDRLVPDAAAITYLDEQGIQEQDRVDLIQGPRLPGQDLVGYGVGDPRDQFGRDGHPVEVFDMALDI